MFVETGLTNLTPYFSKCFFNFFCSDILEKLELLKFLAVYFNFSFFMEGITVCIILLPQYLSCNCVCVNFGFL